MDPYQFEELVARVWEAKGFDTSVTKGSRDRGIDVVAEKLGRKEIIQAKRHDEGNKIGSDTIRKYRTLYQQEPDVNVVVVVTSSEFTGPARELADELKVEIFSGPELIAEIEEHGVDPMTVASESDSGPYISEEFHQECDHCSREFQSISRYRKHLYIDHESELFECESCDEKFIEKEALEAHKEDCEGGSNPSGSSDRHSQGNRERREAKSDVSYRLEQNRDANHKRKANRDVNNRGEAKPEANLVDCDFCNLSVEEDGYWKHLTDTHDDQLVFCYNCKDHFEEESTLREHLYQEHDRSDLGRIDRRRLDQYVNDNVENESAN